MYIHVDDTHTKRSRTSKVEKGLETYSFKTFQNPLPQSSTMTVISPLKDFFFIIIRYGSSRVPLKQSKELPLSSFK